jgi:hypothetical protein
LNSPFADPRRAPGGAARRARPDLHPVDRARVAAAIESAQEDHQLDPLLVLAIIEQESRFDPRARGSHGSIGLMQIRPFVARDVAQRHGIPWKGPRTLLDPAANVAIGACYLGEMFDMYADPALAISAYNLGPYRVQRMVALGKTPRPKYLISVLERFRVFASEFGPFGAEQIEDGTPQGSRRGVPPPPRMRSPEGGFVKQVWIERFGKPEVLKLREASDPLPGPRQVRVRVEAIGVNFADVMGRLGIYPTSRRFPSCPATRSRARSTRSAPRSSPTGSGATSSPCRASAATRTRCACPRRTWSRGRPT